MHIDEQDEEQDTHKKHHQLCPKDRLVFQLPNLSDLKYFEANTDTDDQLKEGLHEEAQHWLVVVQYTQAVLEVFAAWLAVDATDENNGQSVEDDEDDVQLYGAEKL